jgi:hypothetical protein
MNENQTIALETSRLSPVPMFKVIKRITKRTDEDCRLAWEVFEDIMPNDLSTAIACFAAMNKDTKWIYANVRDVMPKELLKGDQRKLEVLALAIEHCVRKAAAIKSKTNEALCKRIS